MFSEHVRVDIMIGGDHGVSWCPDSTTFNQIISNYNSHRILANLRATSIVQNSSCDTDKWLTVDFVSLSPKARFSGKVGKGREGSRGIKVKG